MQPKGLLVFETRDRNGVVIQHYQSCAGVRAHCIGNYIYCIYFEGRHAIRFTIPSGGSFEACWCPTRFTDQGTEIPA